LLSARAASFFSTTFCHFSLSRSNTRAPNEKADAQENRFHL
jgi:hypothetical protein